MAMESLIRPATRATTSRSSASSPAPSSSSCATCPRRAGTWATRSPTCRTACASARELLGTPPEQQPAHHRHHRRPADGVLLARPAVLRVAAVVRRHQHARRAGDAEGGRARHPARASSINTFMLDDSPSLRAFVERMTRINRGRALYTRPDRLGEYLLVDYIAKKRKRRVRGAPPRAVPARQGAASGRDPPLPARRLLRDVLRRRARRVGACST